MDPKKHPEYAQEAEKLANTISTIQHELEQLAPPIEGYGADQRAARLVRQAMLERLEKLKNARSEPYFGRVDWLPLDSNQVDIFYVAKQELSALNIYSWQETLPGDLFYTGRSSRERGKQLLKRRFQIDDDLLKDIGDDFVARERAQLTSFPVMTIPSDEIHADDLLISLLAEHREGLMHDIVATIQEEQYRLISSPLERVLVIQGVAGSGKTSIALHRLSYLLYPRDGKRKLEYQSVLYLAPNPIFLHYVGQVLPELGDRGVPQMTFDDWLVGRLGEKLDYEPEEDSLETLLSRAIEEPVRIMHYRNARNKGSLKMARLLDRFVQNTAEEFIESLGELEVSVPIGRKDGRGREKAIVCRYSAEQNRERFYQVRDSAPSPLALRPWIERFQDGLIRAVLYDARQQVRTTDVDWESVERKGRTSISAQINEYLRAWRQDGDQESSLGRSLNAFIAYRRLLRSPELLHRMGDGIFDRWQLELMHQDAPKQGTPFRFSDLSALLYLHLLIEGTPRSEMLEHVVVDEAQDITPLQFEVIRRLSSNQSFTIMGDLAQGIYADHGLESWTELNAIFGEESIESTVMQRSYRSTQPIMEYTNAMLARIGAASQLMAVPLARSGPEPSEWQFASKEDRIDQIVALVESEQDDGWESIAIIVQTVEACHELAEALLQAGLEDLQLLDSRTESYDGGLVILPGYLAKGLEFDVVMVVDADAATYPPRTLEARLLYVALTRASHSLHVGWIGEITPLLDESIPSLELVDPYVQHLDAEPVTIKEYTQAAALSASTDFYVERLASSGKLHLLEDGRIDRTTLDVLASRWKRSASDEDASIPMLDAQLSNAIRIQIAALADAPDDVHRDALIFLQVTYGLLRNIMRGAGLELDDLPESDPGEQAIALASFLNAVRTSNVQYSVGPMTTPNRVLSSIADESRTAASERLAALETNGMVERSSPGETGRIRVTYEWIEDLLLAALGHIPPQWDRDLWETWPKLPYPISQQVLGSDTDQPDSLELDVESIEGSASHD